MTDSKQNFDNELNLGEILVNLWDGKWIIFFSVSIIFVAVYSAQLLFPRSTFNAKTIIKPISENENLQYNLLNTYRFFETDTNKFFEIDDKILLEKYLEEFDNQNLFIDAIQEFQLIDRTQFEDAFSYDKAVLDMYSKIRIVPPLDPDGSENRNAKPFWTIEFEYHDEKKWMDVISRVNKIATENVRQFFKNKFRISHLIAKQKRRDEIEELDAKIESAWIAYNTIVSRELSYAQDQAAIARKLGISANATETVPIAKQIVNLEPGKEGTIGANFETETPFYLRGYDAIEKEIELLKSRENDSLFVPGLLELEAKKRAIKTDKTLQRAEKIFNSTPVVAEDAFFAISPTTSLAKFEYQDRSLLISIFTAFVGGLFAIIHVLMSRKAVKEK